MQWSRFTLGPGVGGATDPSEVASHDGYMEELLCSNIESALYKVGALHQFMATDTGTPHT